MAATCKYVYMPAAGKIRGNKRTFREWLRSKIRKPVPMYYRVTFNSPIYPKDYGHKK